MPSVTLHSNTLVQVWSLCHDHFLFFCYSFDHCFAHISRLWITMCLDLVKDAKCDVECQRWNCNKVFKLQMHILNKAGWHTHISRHLSFSLFFPMPLKWHSHDHFFFIELYWCMRKCQTTVCTAGAYQSWCLLFTGLDCGLSYLTSVALMELGKLSSVPQHKCTRSVKKTKKKEMTTLFMPVLSV